MNHPQTIARVFGVLYLITFITSIPAVFVFFAPVLNDPRYIVGAGADTSVAFGAFLEMILIIANIGTAVVPFAILRLQNGILTLGFLTARIVESVFIAVGLLSLLTVVTLRQEAAGADPGSLVLVGQSLVALHGWTFVLGPGFVVGIGNGLILGYLMYTSRLIPRYLAVLGLIAGQSLVALKDWTFLLGPGFMVGVGNGLILGYLMYRSALVPRRMAWLGLIGGPLLSVTGVGVMFGVIEAQGVVQSLATIPEALWELFLGIWPIVRGFNRSAIARLEGESG